MIPEIKIVEGDFKRLRRIFEHMLPLKTENFELRIEDTSKCEITITPRFIRFHEVIYVFPLTDRHALVLAIVKKEGRYVLEYHGWNGEMLEKVSERLEEIEDLVVTCSKAFKIKESLS